MAERVNTKLEDQEGEYSGMKEIKARRQGTIYLLYSCDIPKTKNVC